jgi:hypothetical protein
MIEVSAGNLQCVLAMACQAAEWQLDSFHTGQFGSLVPIDQENGVPLPESQRSGIRNLWQPRTIQMTLMYSF